jgi:two-component system response regulator AtoC
MNTPTSNARATRREDAPGHGGAIDAQGPVGRVLVVDDDADMVLLLREALPEYETVGAQSATEALARLEADAFDLVLTDVRMPGMDGIELCSRIGERWPSTPVVVLTVSTSFEAAVAALRAGAYDYLPKPPQIAAMRAAVGRAVERSKLTAELAALQRHVERSVRFEGIIGESEVMRQCFSLLARVASAPSSVVITGESGTGKEGAARAIHARSGRAHKPFVTLNCAAVPDALLEAELFGHTKGAFTDAKSSREGLFVQAHGGTLFLDEIGEMPLHLQPKLLRVLQERVVRPLGGGREVPVDVRVIAATHRDLEEAVRQGTFREDLYFRISVLSVKLPPLRARGTDLLLLAQHFVERYATLMHRNVTGIAPSAARRILAHGWPGNVRELQNAMERAVALTSHSRITEADLPESLARPSSAPAREDGRLERLEDVERRHILEVLRKLGGNRTETAATLGIGRKTLYRKLLAWGVSGPVPAEPAGAAFDDDSVAVGGRRP